MSFPVSARNLSVIRVFPSALKGQQPLPRLLAGLRSLALGGALLAGLGSLGGCGGGYHGSVQCVPYARAHSSISLSGNAAQWWWAARGHYARGHKPVPGSVLVFRATRTMPIGHVAVVRSLESDRRIRVDHANWAPGRVDRDVPVEDVSGSNNWTRVRVWWSPSEVMGRRVNATYGFILPN
ncbi:CHAP domain-containing protein [Oecophyllibacter saccharovorans]|uniref:CHAP domain-containing protein n=1 Tax=Oecophyllibacter saccharovorans TaxID=2558360 RepID=A0A506UL95_9PROT|nr:CHAP domain-containing protein [Oecophyllibacter saccharovorans]